MAELRALNKVGRRVLNKVLVVMKFRVLKKGRLRVLNKV